ncbi:MAG: hypothetical protein ACLFQX_05575 [Candidatus Kapaibacterium sp.]
MLSELTIPGLIFWIIGWGGVSLMVGYCIYKVMRTGHRIDEE